MEDYLKKRIERLLSVLKPQQLGDELGVSKRTIYYWKKAPGMIPARHIGDIKRLHVRLRNRINYKERKG